MLSLLFKSITTSSTTSTTTTTSTINNNSEEPASTLIEQIETDESNGSTRQVLGVLMGVNVNNNASSGDDIKPIVTITTSNNNNNKKKQFWRPNSTQSTLNYPSSTSPSNSTSISHTAKVLYYLFAGEALPIESKRGKKLNQQLQPDHPLNPTSPKISTPKLSIDVSTNGKFIETKCVPHISAKSLKKLKSDLVKPVEARKIVCDLKRIQLLDESQKQDLLSTGQCQEGIKSDCVGYALPVLLSDVDKENSTSTSTDTSGSTPIQIVSAFSLITPATIIGAVATKSGAFELLGGLSGALINDSSQPLMIVPFDRISVFTYWWGYELCCPPETLKVLANVHSVQGTFFAFLTAFAASGGAPQLAPLIRYISSYLDMEWSAIVSQNKGNGVILAATYLLPLAIIPRPWDFALPPPLSTLPSS